jgi:Na+-transporting NADH:ubiquinone oxidoreductase subunit NqrF
MKTEKRFNYNDIELVRMITEKVYDEEKWGKGFYIYSFIPNNIEKIIIEMGDWWEIKITDRKEIYVNTGELKERIRQKIEDKRKRDNERIKERLFLQEIEERKKREFQENFDKLTPEMKAFFYVATALGREYLQACKNQNSYTVQNPYYHNNLLDNFLL